MVKRDYCWLFVGVIFLAINVWSIIHLVQLGTLIQQLHALGADTNLQEQQWHQDILNEVGQCCITVLIVTPLTWREMRRQRAARGKGRVAHEQPLPQALLVLPRTYHFRLGLVVSLMLWVPYVLLAALFFMLSVIDTMYRQSWIFFYVGFLLIGGVLYGGFALWQARRLDISEEGLTYHHYGRQTQLRWEDARLFAILLTTKAGKASMMELSGATATIRWPTAFGMIWSDMTVDDVRVLSEQIVAKTGLALYHL